MKSFYTLFIVFCTFVLVAQRPTTLVCGYDLALDIYEKKYPGYKEVLNQAFDDAQRLSQNGTLRNNVFRIPVVIHIVWRNDQNYHVACPLLTEVATFLLFFVQRM